ncbi:tetratricopeptide repeat protein [Chryseobacterium sp. L7]|uniref:Tetratricopeptide repeat protein n=1 Tax=Chryseobacterium endalhagicum TaxID=2797638 RepID=A0ABS1QA32_9FLAO|nr:tetratricopeptide repeat protein [Chryseobacterium endalhagicum]MBL1219469.1 tetratricopeptide repeat protein [Chryseobacterium endalhagicum]
MGLFNKKIIILGVLFSISISFKIGAQDFLQKLDTEFCNCLSGKTNYTDETFNTCSSEVMSKLKKDLENYHKTIGYKNKDDFMKDFMVRLINNCEPFFMHMTDLKKIGMDKFRNDYKEITIDSLKKKFNDTKLLIDYQEMANWYFANNKTEEAEKMYKEILRNEPDQMEATYMLGLLYDELGKYQEAKVLYDKVYNNTGNIQYKLYSEMDLKRTK